MDKKIIMIVDDADEIRMEIKALLESHDFFVRDFSSSKKAADYLKNHEEDISLFIFDYHMPVMNGLELCDYVRNDPNYKGTPIFMLTTERNADLMKKGKEQYRARWLVKPLNPPILIKHISSLTNLGIN